MDLSTTNRVYIKNEDLEKKKLKTYWKGDIVFARVGDVASGIIWSVADAEKITISPNIIAVRTDDNKLDSLYSVTFFNSVYGINQLKQAQKTVAQATISTSLIKNLLIPVPTRVFQQKIRELLEESFKKKAISESKISNANEQLLASIGVHNFIPSKVSYSSRSYKKCIEANRFDSEYWLPKYDQLLEVIQGQEHASLDSLFYKPIKGIEVGSSEYVGDDGIPFVRVSDFSVFGIDENTDKRISTVTYEKLKDSFKPKVGELLFTKDGTVGITAVLDKEVECVLSGAFLRLQTKSTIDSHYLSILINSLVCRMQIERLSGGALITHFKPGEIEKILVPLVEESAQKKIGDEVRNAFQLRIQSKELLEVAKRAVEVFIEQDENSALQYINHNYEHL